MDQITPRKWEFCLLLPEDKVKSNLTNFNEGLYVVIAMNINEHFNTEKHEKLFPAILINIKGSFYFIYVYIFTALPHIASRLYPGLSLFDLS